MTDSPALPATHRVELDAHRVLFVTRRSSVKDVASANVPLSFGVGTRLPEIALEVPTAKLRRAPDSFVVGLALATVAW